ncbi:MAG TPA: CPBP family glutamic-type intramembrane protease [Puia sp.]|nr:CPBP family glutamic-type intramembrane protease [Puia sp.]
MDWMNWRFAFAAAATLCWSIYVIYRFRNGADILAYWGFRTDNFGSVARTILPVGALAIIVFFVIGFYRHTINITWHIIPILILYPIWGVIQQFLLIALIVGNLKDLTGIRLNQWTIVLLAAILFSCVHYPFVWLMTGTFFLSVFYGFIYLRVKNIYVLGLFHGWLGGIFYYTVVGRDPFVEMFHRMSHL